MHPGTRILLCLISALALPGLSFFYLLVLSFMLLPIALRAPGRLRGLFRRPRWLFLALILGYGFTLPGDPLIHDWGGSPSIGGLQAGLLQAWRLALLIFLIDWLVLRLAPEALLAGLYGLIKPLGRLGASPERFAVRLGLTLQALSQMGSIKLGPVEALEDRHRADALPDEFVLELASWRGMDYSILAGVSLGVGWLWLNG